MWAVSCKAHVLEAALCAIYPSLPGQHRLSWWLVVWKVSVICCYSPCCCNRQVHMPLARVLFDVQCLVKSKRLTQK